MSAWRVEPTPASSHQCYRVMDGKVTVARVGDGNEYGEEPHDEGNACLIAAAPAMLDALASCVAALNRETGAGRLAAVTAARAAIAKATGSAA